MASKILDLTDTSAVGASVSLAAFSFSCAFSALALTMFCFTGLYKLASEVLNLAVSKLPELSKLSNIVGVSFNTFLDPYFDLGVYPVMTFSLTKPRDM